MVDGIKNNSIKNLYPDTANAIIDSGAFRNYFPLQSLQTKISQSTKVKKITQPNGEKV